MIRVLQYIGSLEMGGSQAFVMEIYRKIDKNKIQFDFITFPGERGVYYDEIRSLGGKIYECPKLRGYNIFSFLRWWSCFFKSHSEYRILHGHIRSTASLYMSVAKKYGVKCIAHSHSSSNGHGIKALVKNILQYPLRYIADYLFACSDKAGIWLYGEKAFNGPKYGFIPNCIDIDSFRFSLDKRNDLRESYHISPDTFLIGHVGRFHEAKNHDFIIDVFNEVLKLKNDSKLILIGDGDNKAHIEEKVKEYGICDKVIFAGTHKDLSAYYSAMDLFLFPSLWEGLPISVVEAEASGVYILISNTVTDVVCLNHKLRRCSLKRSAVFWAKAALLLGKLKRSKILELDRERLETFDSVEVAKELERFYRGVAKGVL